MNRSSARTGRRPATGRQAARRLRTALAGLAATLTLASVTAGLPLALLRFGGSPIPRRLPSVHHVVVVLLHRDGGGLFLSAVRDLSWLAWAAFTFAVFSEAQAALRGRRPPRLHLAGLQGAAARLVAAASLTFATPAVVTLMASPAIAAEARPATAEHDHRAWRTITVRPGDSLWSIARRYLGAGDRYEEIVRLNLGRDMGGGAIFTDPSLIRAGWQLRVPDPAASHHNGTHSTKRGDHSQSPGPAAAAAAESAAADAAAGSAVAPQGQPHGIEQAMWFTLGMLAGSVLASLDRLRHRQRQNRRTGRRIALPSDDASVRIEQKLRAARPLVPPASLREALVQLNAGVAASGDLLPQIAGVHVTAGSLDVLLSAPAAGPPPTPFTIAPARQAMCWTADLRRPQPESSLLPPAPGEAADVLPGLFTAGATEAGGYLLLDLEAMGVTCCDGPGDLTDRFLVTAATELASSRWSGWYELLLAGYDELDVLGRAEMCRDLEHGLALLEDRASTVALRLNQDGQADVRARRIADPEDEDWILRLLVSRIPPSPEQMSRLLDLADGPGGVAALVAGDTQAEEGKMAPAVFQLGTDADAPDEIIATITLAHLGPHNPITVRPQTLTAAEYEGLAGLLATATQIADVGSDEPPYPGCEGPAWIRPAAGPLGPDEHSDQDEGFWGSAAQPDGDTFTDGQPGSDAITPAPAASPDGPHAERSVPAELDVNVLGAFELLGSAEPLAPKQAELVLALALSGSSGVSGSALCTLLGVDPDHPRPADSVRQLITRTRRRLGQARDGREYIVHLGSGIYVPHEDVRLDWSRFITLARRGRASRSVGELRAAMDLVRGQPFADCFHWWIDVALVETMRAEIIDTAELLAELELAAGDPVAAAAAARAGLAAESAAEQLWRALMRAEHEAGNPLGVTAAWAQCLDAITEIAPGGEPHPDTEQLYRRLIGGRLPAGLR
jgi:DNA-binding SARP family transcriptional activator